jgi:hypothetical protein
MRKAGEGKELFKFDGGHFDAYRGKGFEVNIKRQIEFLKKHLYSGCCGVLRTTCWNKRGSNRVAN